LLARRLDISLRTVEMHRANMMDRLQVSSLAEALTLAVQAGVEPLEQE
jgi:two-component system response regulator FixJ